MSEDWGADFHGADFQGGAGQDFFFFFFFTFCFSGADAASGDGWASFDAAPAFVAADFPAVFPAVEFASISSRCFCSRCCCCRATTTAAARASVSTFFASRAKGGCPRLRGRQAAATLWRWKRARRL